MGRQDEEGATVNNAKFGPADHAIIAGWATYHDPHLRGRWWQRLRCWVIGHTSPIEIPPTPNGYSPNNYVRCVKCSNAMHWYVVGQHRHGGMNAKATSTE